MISDRLLDRAEPTAQMLSLLGNARRLAIMVHLSRGEMSVGSIAEAVGLGQSALSQHLAKLRKGGLVATRRDRQTIYYRCDCDTTLHLLAEMDRMASGGTAVAAS